MTATTAPPRPGRAKQKPKAKAAAGKLDRSAVTHGKPKAARAAKQAKAVPGAKKAKAAPAAKVAKAAPAAKVAKAVPAAKKLTKAAKLTAVVMSDGPPGLSKVGRKLALKAAKAMAIKALRSGVEAVQRAGALTIQPGAGAIDVLHRQLPIQRSLDVAVPLGVAWQEWMTFPWLPEGIHRVRDIGRENDGRLSGRTAGATDVDWEAEILDERDRQSFAWRSIKGSDCAGLVTFHKLSDRLTRLELTLDIVPTSVPEALALSTHLADHRAEADLRRFKARVELINPDAYEEYENHQAQDGDGASEADGDE